MDYLKKRKLESLPPIVLLVVESKINYTIALQSCIHNTLSTTAEPQ